MSDDPITATVMGLSAAGTAISAVSALNQGKTQADVTLTNAKLQARERIAQAQMAERGALEAIQEASAEREAGAYEEARQREHDVAYQATQRAMAGASGLEFTGSPMLIMVETARQQALDRLALRHASETRAREAEDAAVMQRYQAGELRQGAALGLDLGRYQAKVARRAGEAQAIASLFSGAASGAKLYAAR